MTSALAFDQLAALTGPRRKADAPCPLCAPIYNAKKKTLRVWNDGGGFVGFHCARCGEKGWARDGRSATRLAPDRLAAIRQEAATRDAAERAAGLRKSRFLWVRRQPITPGSPPFNYLRGPRGYGGPIPVTLGYLLPAKPEHHHAMIAAFGLAHEPEPGVIDLNDNAVMGVHLTLLRPDGSDKADGIENTKITVGRGSTGFPICIAPPNDLMGLTIAEGIEDALSIHQATGLGAWAAGTAGRLPALVDKIPSFIDCVTILAHPDPAGQAGAVALADALTARGLEVIVQGITP
jgi:hypothetical protein